jgi:hypothetical protein
LKALTADANGNPIPFTSGPYGGFVYVRADVVGQSGNGTATGTVTIKDNGTPITGSPFALNSQGNTATPSGIFTLGSGPHTITATYSGDASFNAGPAGSTAVTITPAITTLSNPSVQSPALLGSSVPVNSDLTGTSCGNPATGTIDFFAGTTKIGTSPVILSSINQAGCVLTGFGSIATTTLPLGINTITAKYSGDANYAAATSPSSTVDIDINTAAALTASAMTITQPQSDTFTATITPAQAGPPVTGTVKIQASISSCSAMVTNGVAQCALSSFMVGGPQIVEAFYQGDTNYAPSIAEVSITVNPGPDFSMMASPASITVARPGQSGSTSLMLTAMNGLTGTFNLVPQCINLPSESTCAVAPASVTFSSTMTTATVMLTVSTRAPSSAPASRRFQPTNNRPGAIIVVGLLALLSLLGLRRGRRGIQIAFSVVTLAALLTFAACGGGSGGGGGGGGVHDPGTPVGLDSAASVSFTIGTATHAVPISINVQ